jgi:hypothetical protein
MCHVPVITGYGSHQDPQRSAIFLPSVDDVTDERKLLLKQRRFCPESSGNILDTITFVVLNAVIDIEVKYEVE